MNEEIKQVDRTIIETYRFFVIGLAKGKLLQERFVGKYHLYASKPLPKLLKS